MVETSEVLVTRGRPEFVETPTASGTGQIFARCPTCRIALWSHYSAAGEAVAFVRVGSLDEPSRLPPDIHIFVDAKQSWLTLPPGALAVPQYYRRSEVWTPENVARYRAVTRRQ